MRISKHNRRSPLSAGNSALYFVAGLLLVAWGIAYLAYTPSGIIHILLVLAAVAVVIGIIRDNKLL